MQECLFCKIIEKKVPTFIVYEDNFNLAFLDIKPRSKGMTIVVPKKHYESFDDDFENSFKTFQAALLIGKKLKKVLNPIFISLSILPSEVKHFHIRLYPVFSDKLPIVEGNPVPISEEELKKLAEEIRSVKIIEEKKEEKIKRSEKEVEWIKRYWERA